MEDAYEAGNITHKLGAFGHSRNKPSPRHLYDSLAADKVHKGNYRRTKSAERSDACFEVKMSGQQPTPQQQDAYLAQMRQQVQAQFMQDLIHKITDQCYKKCTTPSGSGLSSREKRLHGQLHGPLYGNNANCQCYAQ